MSRTNATDPVRRRFLARFLMGAAMAPLALLHARCAQASELPLLEPSSPAARKLEYVADASQAKRLAKGNSCATCGLYQGTYGSKRGACQLFPGKAVLASAWCSSWEPQM
ncbi:MAG TPA: high-potential iron-sulfur protein [Steroidobacteraceae bacterium]